MANLDFSQANPDPNTVQGYPDLVQALLRLQGGPSLASTLTDMARGAGSGAAEGLYGLAGLPGDIDKATRGVGIWFANKMRALDHRPPIASADLPPRFLANIAATSSDLQNADGFSPYSAQTMPGKLARKAVLSLFRAAVPPL